MHSTDNSNREIPHSTQIFLPLDLSQLLLQARYVINSYSKTIQPFQTKYFLEVVVLTMKMRGLLEVVGVLRRRVHIFYSTYKKNIT